MISKQAIGPGNPACSSRERIRAALIICGGYCRKKLHAVPRNIKVPSQVHADITNGTNRRDAMGCRARTIASQDESGPGLRRPIFNLLTGTGAGGL